MSSVITTYLSDYVHLILVEYGFDRHNRIIKPNPSFLELPSILYSWKEIELLLLDISDDLDLFNESEEWYSVKIQTVWAAIHSAGAAVSAADSSERDKLYQLASWVCDPVQLAEFYQSSQQDDGTDVLLPILLMTAAFERALRNLYLTKNSPVPFLLRDILKTPEISQTFGEVPTLFAQLILGCPKGLNIRNVAWHGFISPGELHPDLVPGLIVMFASLGQLLPPNLVLRELKSVYVFGKFYKDLHGTFPDLQRKKSEVLNILETSSHLNERSLVFWKKAYTLFLNDRYGDSLVLLIPQLEHCLRTIFCQVNDCPARLLTAEATTSYTTLDEILTFSSKPVAGDGMLMMLLDLTASMSGPRLRDKLSHGELDAAAIPCWFTNHVFALALSVRVTNKEVTCNQSLCSELQSAVSLYRSKFHVFVTLYQLTDSLLAEWVEMENCAVTPTDLPDVVLRTCISISSMDSLLFPNINVLSEKVSLAREVLKKNIPSTLFRPRLELEVATSLVNMVRRVSNTARKIDDAVLQFRQLWDERSLRSRSRQTALRMWSVLPDLFTTLRCVLMIVSVLYYHIQKLPRMKKMQRLLKSMTKLVENTVVMCDRDRNHWKEAHQLSSALSCEIQQFFSFYRPLLPFLWSYK